MIHHRLFSDICKKIYFSLIFVKFPLPSADKKVDAKVLREGVIQDMKNNHFNLKSASVLVLLTVFFFSGCASELVCRHHVLELASMGVEKRLETRISVYKVNHPLWEAHAQAQVKVDGKWKWLNDWFGYVVFENDPSYTPTGYMLFYSIPEYLDVLHKGSYSTEGVSTSQYFYHKK